MSRLVSAFKLAVGFLFASAVALPFFLLAFVLIPWRQRRIKLGNFYGKIVGRSILFVTGATVEIHHRERLDASFPAIYVSNHTSSLDFFTGIWLCPVGGCGVVKKEFLRIPIIGQLYRLGGHLLIDRENHASAVASLSEIAALMRRHRLGVWMMPEGTRSADGRLLPFKKGFVHLAIATGLNVVPVAVAGGHVIWPKKTFSLRGGPLRIDVLEPIDTSRWTEATAAEHCEEVRRFMAGALGQEALAKASRVAVSA
jgi:1-acyl-sn-glycerol-3-phosphate acyltransferase